ncbi:MAG: hypothetical protein AAF721_32995, partial [Myxococcota bacterium]
MSSISNVFDPSRSVAAESTASTKSDSAGATSAFSGALEQAERELEPEQERPPSPEDTIVGLEVLGAQDRLQRSGVPVGPGGVPSPTNDGPPEAILIEDSPAYLDATATTQQLQAPGAEANDGIVRGDVVRNPGARKWKTARLTGPPPPPSAGAKPMIPPPPIPGSATRNHASRQSMRQTLSYAVRAPASGRTTVPTSLPHASPQRGAAGDAATAATHTRAAPPPRRTPTGETRVVSDGEVTRVWSRPAMERAAGLPPAPPWTKRGEAEPPVVRVSAPVPAPTTEAPPVRRAARQPTHRDNASAIVSGPLRAYAAAMSPVT